MSIDSAQRGRLLQTNIYNGTNKHCLHLHKSLSPTRTFMFMNNYTKFIFTLKVHLYLDNYSPFRRSRPNKGRTMQVDSSHLGCVVRVTSTSGSQKFRKIWTLLDICKKKGITSLKYLHCWYNSLIYCAENSCHSSVNAPRNTCGRQLHSRELYSEQTIEGRLGRRRIDWASVQSVTDGESLTR